MGSELARAGDSEIKAPAEEQRASAFGIDLSNRGSALPSFDNRNSTYSFDQSHTLDSLLSGFYISGTDNGAAKNTASAGDQSSAERAGAGAAANKAAEADAAGAATRDKQAKAGADIGDSAASAGDSVAGMMAKIGQFLQSILPPEYAQYVSQYLPMAEQYIGQLLNDVHIGTGQNGAQRIETDLKEPKTIPDVVDGSNLEVSQKLGFDMKWGAEGPELSNIQGLKLSGQVAGDIRSARISGIEDGNPSLYATVQGTDGQSTEVPIPLPDIQNLLGL